VDSLYSLVVGTNGRRSGLRRYNLLYAGSWRLARSMELDEVLDTLETDLHLTVAVGARRKVFVRAGVVGWRGRAIVILGRRRSGASSLLSALVLAGATHYSDRYAVFDARGRVHPYPTPPTRRTDGERRKNLRMEQHGKQARAPLPVGMIVVTQYRPGTRWRPRVLSPGQAMLALLEHTPAARARPAVALKTLSRIVGKALALEGSRGEADETVAAMLTRLDRSAISAADRGFVAAGRGGV